MKAVRSLILALVVALAPACASAWTHGTAIFTQPLLQSQTVNFGSLTTAGTATRGGSVRLSSVDDTTDYAVITYGLDMLIPGNNAPAFWTITATNSNNVWKFNNVNLASGVESAQVAEGVDALTPVPVTTLTNAATGPYTFTVKAYDATGLILLDTKTLTYDMVANAVSLGNNDAFDNTSIPSGNFRNGTVSAPEILLSTGFFVPSSRLGAFDVVFTAGHPVTVQWANPSKPGALASISMNEGAYWTFSNLVLTGNINGMTFNAIWNFQGQANNMIVANGGAMFTQATGNVQSVTNQSPISFSALLFDGSNNITVYNFNAQWVNQGITDANGVINTNIFMGSATRAGGANYGAHIRYFTNNAIFVSGCNNCQWYDVTDASPVRTSLAHIDSFQISAGYNPQNSTFGRFISVQADGNAAAQGMFFSNGPNIYTAFIDDGSGNGTPSGVAGQVMTITAVTTQQGVPLTGQWFQGANFTGPYQVNGTVTTLVTGVSYKVPLNIGSNLNIASGQVATAGMNNTTFNGFITSSYLAKNCIVPAGLSGTGAIENFVSFLQNSPAANINYAVVTGSSSTASKSLPFTYVSGTPIGNPQDVYTSPGITGTHIGTIASTSGNVFGTATITLSANATQTNSAGTTFYSTDDQPAIPANNGNGPAMELLANDVPYIWAGTPTISSGFSWNPSVPILIPYLGGSSTWPTGKPSTLTLNTANVIFSNFNSTGVATNSFSGGSPQTQAEAISTASWAAMSMATLIGTYASIAAPKVGGPLDINGSGTGGAYGAINFSGQWNDGSGLTPQ